MENKTQHIGLDLSLNASGICSYIGDKTRFYYLTPEHKKAHKSSSVITYKYEKWSSEDYSESEIFKIHNGRRQAYQIIKMLNKLIDKNCETIYLTCEAPPTRINKFNTNSHLDLIRANSIVMERVMFFCESSFPENKFVFNMISNSTIKKTAGVRGRGSCKDQIVDKWKEEKDFSEWFDFSDKLDDLADAYFAAKWSENLITK